MKNNEEYMFNIRKINKILKSSNTNEEAIEYKNKLITEYSKMITQDCIHEICIDLGYFRIKGKEVWVSDRENADFRVVECENCDQEIYLVKNNDEMWDTKIGNNIINIKANQLCKRV